MSRKNFSKLTNESSQVCYTHIYIICVHIHSTRKGAFLHPSSVAQDAGTSRISSPAIALLTRKEGQPTTSICVFKKNLRSVWGVHCTICVQGDKGMLF